MLWIVCTYWHTRRTVFTSTVMMQLEYACGFAATQDFGHGWIEACFDVLRNTGAREAFGGAVTCLSSVYGSGASTSRLSPFSVCCCTGSSLSSLLLGSALVACRSCDRIAWARGEGFRNLLWLLLIETLLRQRLTRPPGHSSGSSHTWQVVIVGMSARAGLSARG